MQNPSSCSSVLLDGCVGNRLQSCSVIPSHKSDRLSHTLIVEHRRWHATAVLLLEKLRFRVQDWHKSEEEGWSTQAGQTAGGLGITPVVWICGLWPPEERNIGAFAWQARHAHAVPLFLFHSLTHTLHFSVFLRRNHLKAAASVHSNGNAAVREVLDN